ncbi:hypothetical protein M0805_000660 [Coniferiporia weirii]|nr:hypothetical protein M0805_000660 [Coniferiporia weirii]
MPSSSTDPTGESANGINENDPGARQSLALWFFFQITANNIGLPILVATFLLAKTVRRNPTLINMCITWIIAGISSSLLLYAGKELGEEPGHALCIAQASLLYGTPPMCSVSALALIYTVWKSLSCMKNESAPKSSNARIYALQLLVAPYIALLSFAIATAVVASRDLQRVNRDRRFFYCSVDDSGLSDTLALFTVVICLLCLLLEIHTAFRIVRAWRAFKAMSGGSDIGKRGLDMQLIVRLFIFSGYILIALVFSATSIMSPKSVVPDLFSASIGMAVFLVFGTQPDVLRTWAFWLHIRPPVLPPKDFVVKKPDSAPSLFQEQDLYRPAPRAGTIAKLNMSESPDGDDAASVRSSFSTRKGDSVIIIGKPEEAFGGLGKRDSV